MYFDLNIPINAPASLKYINNTSKKKGKQKAGDAATATPGQSVTDLFTTEQIAAIENKMDILTHLGYTVVAFTQRVESSFSPNGHVNYLEELVRRLKKREGITYLTRLMIILDDASEKGTGLSKQHQAQLGGYDILSLHPTTANTFSLACLKHSQPSPLTTHIISLPLTGPRLPFFFKHTLVRTAVKNGVVFEILYSPAVGGVGDVERRNWWAACRELIRVTSGKGVIFSSGSTTNPMTDVRAPKDVMNIAVMLGFSQDEAQKAMRETSKKLAIRAYTRKTHQAVLSEPTLVYADEGPSASSEPLNEQNLTLKRLRERIAEEDDRPTKKVKP